MAYLPDTALTTECLCLLRLREVESQHANVYLQSGWDPLPPSFNQTAVLCLFAISVAFMVTTHTGGQGGEAPSVPVEKDEWDSHTPEKEKRHMKFGAMHPCSDRLIEFSTVLKKSLTVCFVRIIKDIFKLFF